MKESQTAGPSLSAMGYRVDLKMHTRKVTMLLVGRPHAHQINVELMTTAVCCHPQPPGENYKKAN